MRAGEEEAVEQFSGAMTDLKRHLSFLHAHNGAVLHTSQLAVDDQLWPHHPVSQVAWHAMTSAADHLDLMNHVASLAPDRIFLTAPASVARGALVAASQALRILGPEEAEIRQQRALSIAIAYLNHRIGYQTEQLKVCSPEQRTLSQAQIDDLLLPMRQEALKRVKKGYNFNDTTGIEEATRLRFTDNVENSVVTSNLIWRRLGGDAHALGWQLLLGPLEWAEEAPPDELSTVAIRGDLAEMLQASMWAATFLRVAVERFQELSGVSMDGN
jgi:hypothetical protein